MNTNEVAQIKSLYRSREFALLKKIAFEMIAQLYKELPTGETQFQYLKNSLTRDGMIHGIDQYIKEIERISNE